LSIRLDNIPDLSLVFPLFNEEQNIVSLISSISDEFDKHNINYELVMVNNGSLDSTGKILRERSKSNPRLKIVTIEKNQGYGLGIIKGLRNASGKYLGFMCGDGQIAPADIVNVYFNLQNGDCDLSKVVRVQRQDGLIRYLNSLVYNLLFRRVFGIPSADINGTPKIFKRALFEKLDLLSKDWFVDCELMIKTSLLSVKMKEIPVVFLPRKDGSSNVRIGHVVEFIRNMIRYKFGREIRRWKKKELSS